MSQGAAAPANRTADQTAGHAASGQRLLVIACGALAREVLALIELNGWSHMDLICLPAKLHNTPDRIPELVRQKVRAGRRTHQRIIVLYGDCGTGGELDRVLAEEGVERVPGPHCYAFYEGVEQFLGHAEAEPGCFYLTDFLVRHFHRLVVQGLGLDRHPELRDLYFGNYIRLVYLAQTPDLRLERKAKAAANFLKLAYEHRPTGYGQLAEFMKKAS
ncbi:MAG: DUF1638 domain-containing protein [Geminicoccaceae bacterium]